jgi:preprotein translocase subunit SecB
VKQHQEVFEISVESPGAPKYFIYKEALALKLKAKLDKEYGEQYKISLKRHLDTKNTISKKSA